MKSLVIIPLFVSLLLYMWLKYWNTMKFGYIKHKYLLCTSLKYKWKITIFINTNGEETFNVINHQSRHQESGLIWNSKRPMQAIQIS